MPPAYPGPLRGEPLPIELHNTLYATGGRAVDGLADEQGLRMWLTAVAGELPVKATAVDGRHLDEFIRLRAAVRRALHAALDGEPVPAGALDALNAVSAASPHSLALVQRGTRSEAKPRFHAPDATDVVLGVLASQTIELLAGPDAEHLRACGAPGCVLMFLKDHPRQEWCSSACGNRARQARHYARTRRAGTAVPDASRRAGVDGLPAGPAAASL